MINFMLQNAGIPAFRMKFPLLTILIERLHIDG
jgi:hypothetical protein